MNVFALGPSRFGGVYTIRQMHDDGTVSPQLFTPHEMWVDSFERDALKLLQEKGKAPTKGVVERGVKGYAYFFTNDVYGLHADGFKPRISPDVLGLQTPDGYEQLRPEMEATEKHNRETASQLRKGRLDGKFCILPSGRVEWWTQ